ncbi:hypothetical protein ACK336_20200 [Aeromonas veronii]
MKDVNDNQTVDLLPLKRPRGRPSTGKAMTQAERQAKYRAKVAQNNVTVTVNRGLLERLDAQMQALRDGSSAQILTPEEAGLVLDALRRAQMVQLKGQGR